MSKEVKVEMSERDELALALYGVKYEELNEGQQAEVEAESITNGGGALDTREMDIHISGAEDEVEVITNTPSTAPTLPEERVFSETLETEGVYKLLEKEEKSSKAELESLESIGAYMNEIETRELMGDHKTIEAYMRWRFSTSNIAMRLKELNAELSEAEINARAEFESDWLNRHLKKSKEVFRAMKWLKDNRVNETEGKAVELFTEIELENISDEALSEASRVLAKKGGSEALLKALKEDGAGVLKTLKLRNIKSKLNGGTGTGDRAGGVKEKYKSLVALVLAQIETLDSEEVGEKFGELVDWLEDNETEALKEARARVEAEAEAEEK